MSAGNHDEFSVGSNEIPAENRKKLSFEVRMFYSFVAKLRSLVLFFVWHALNTRIYISLGAVWLKMLL